MRSDLLADWLAEACKILLLLLRGVSGQPSMMTIASLSLIADHACYNMHLTDLVYE